MNRILGALALLSLTLGAARAADLTGKSYGELIAMAAICAPVSEQVCAAIPREIVGHPKQLEPGPCQLGQVPYPAEYASCSAVDSEMAVRNTANRAAQQHN